MLTLIEYLKEEFIGRTISADGHIDVAGDLAFYGSNNIPELPDNLTVGGCLYLWRTQITTLPYTLKVALNIRGFKK